MLGQDSTEDPRTALMNAKEFLAEMKRLSADRQYGAKMGWTNWPHFTFSEAVKVRMTRVAIPNGYDADGYHYGPPDNLYQVEPEHRWIHPFRLRAYSRDDAKATVRGWLKNATFYN